MSPTVQNIRLLIEYDGSDFLGWQIQAGGAPTIQGEIESALQKITGRRVILYGAGRTDSGVHARGQVANFFSDKDIAPDHWRYVLNCLLPAKIRILKSESVAMEFHSQKDAVCKRYEYRILNGRTVSAFDQRVWFYPKTLDWDGIRNCLPFFLGEKDFRAFQGAKSSVTNTIRRVSRFELEQEDEKWGVFRFKIEGNGFLKQMVRTMIGTVVEVGERRRDPSKIADLFHTRDRRQAGRTAPAAGLCLAWVKY